MKTKITDLRVAYLGTCYTHKESRVRQERVNRADEVAAELMSKRLAVFSPISHGHRVSAWLRDDNTNSAEFWMEQCLPMVRRADLFILLPQGGWRESQGLRDELLCCKEFGVPVYVYQNRWILNLEVISKKTAEALGFKLLPTGEPNLTLFINNYASHK